MVAARYTVGLADEPNELILKVSGDVSTILKD